MCCADFLTELNKCLELYNYPLKSPEESFADLNGGKTFSKQDISKAYLQKQVVEKCSE